MSLWQEASPIQWRPRSTRSPSPAGNRYLASKPTKTYVVLVDICPKYFTYCLSEKKKDRISEGEQVNHTLPLVSWVYTHTVSLPHKSRNGQWDTMSPHVPPAMSFQPCPSSPACLPMSFLWPRQASSGPCSPRSYQTLADLAALDSPGGSQLQLYNTSGMSREHPFNF